MFADVSMVEFVPLGKKLKRASTGKEDNFVPSYLPSNLPLDVDSAEQLEKVGDHVKKTDHARIAHYARI